MGTLSPLIIAFDGRLLPLWEKVREGRMRGFAQPSQTPHPALRATFSHKGRRQVEAKSASERAHHGRH